MGGMTYFVEADMRAAPVTVGIDPLSFEDVIAVARHDAPVELSPEAEAEISRSREVVETP